MTRLILYTAWQVVVIIDPHLKRTQSYPVYTKASELGILIKPASGEGEFEGWCWAGSSSWVDFFNPASWDWWTSLYQHSSDSQEWHWTASTDDIFIWNDMNEVRHWQGLLLTYFDILILAVCIQWS